MALSCCRLLSGQSKQSIQYVFRYSHSTGNRTTQNLFRKWSKEARGSQSFQILSRNFRSRKTTSTPSNQILNTESQGNSFSLFKSTVFVSGICGCSFLGAMIWNYENVRKVYKDLATDKPSPHHQHFHPKMFGFRQHLQAMWSSLDTSSKLTFGIIAANAAVWILWKVPRLQSGMIRYFSSAAAHPRLSMVLSSFSHISFFHLAVNMYVLMSFAPVAAKVFGYEQFSAFYISAGTMSAFASILCQQLLKRPPSISVGASGAIMGLLGVTAILFPRAQLQVAFVSEIIPHSFSAETGIKAIVLFDLLGLFLGWKVLDHAGHLGGMLFGILYAKYGNKLVWSNRDSIVRSWHNLRGKP